MHESKDIEKFVIGDSNNSFEISGIGFGNDAVDFNDSDDEMSVSDTDKKSVHEDGGFEYGEDGICHDTEGRIIVHKLKMNYFF